VTGGTLTIYPAGDGNALNSIDIQPDGTYSHVGLPAGDMVATVETESVNPAGKSKPEDYGKKMGKGGVRVRAARHGDPSGRRWTVCEDSGKYGKKDTSGLKLTLKAGKNDNQDFDLKDEPDYTLLA